MLKNDPSVNFFDLSQLTCTHTQQLKHFVLLKTIRKSGSKKTMKEDLGKSVIICSDINQEFV